MWKIAAVCLATLAVSAQQPVFAQGSQGSASKTVALSAEDSKELIDRRVEVLKEALRLSPDQAKLWPAVEDAIRARLTARHARINQIAERMNQDKEADVIELMRFRAASLTQRGASLQK